MRSIALLILGAIAQMAVGQSIDDLLRNESLKHASVGIVVQRISDGALIYSHDADRGLVPASTLKLFTALPAWQKLGPDYRYRTAVSYTGRIESDGTLTGDLIIEASGDPTLGSSRIADSPDAETLLSLLADKIAKKITCIDGHIVVDISNGAGHYPVQRDWLYEDVGNYYGGGAWPLNFRENQYEIYFDRSAAIGQPTRIQRITPDHIGLHLDNQVRVDRKGSGDQAYILGGPYNSYKTIVGTLPQGSKAYKVKGALPDPPAYFARALAEQMRARGVDSQGSRVDTKGYSETKLLTRIQSPKLRSIIKEILMRSNNLYTEAVYRTLVAEGAVEPVADGQRAQDACGLATTNRVTAGYMVDVMRRAGEPSAELLACMPLAGERGGLQRFFAKGSAGHGQIWAKSGSMSGVQCYAGYMHGQDGQWYVFASLINNYTGSSSDIRKLQAQLMGRLWAACQ